MLHYEVLSSSTHAIYLFCAYCKPYNLGEFGRTTSRAYKSVVPGTLVWKDVTGEMIGIPGGGNQVTGTSKKWAPGRGAVPFVEGTCVIGKALLLQLACNNLGERALGVLQKVDRLVSFRQAIAKFSDDFRVP
jgi:hypothetical protein